MHYQGTGGYPAKPAPRNEQDRHNRKIPGKGKRLETNIKNNAYQRTRRTRRDGNQPRAKSNGEQMDGMFQQLFHGAYIR